MSTNTKFKLRMSRDNRIIFCTGNMSREDAKKAHDLFTLKFSPIESYRITVIAVEPETSWNANYATSLEDDQQ